MRDFIESRYIACVCECVCMEDIGSDVCSAGCWGYMYMGSFGGLNVRRVQIVRYIYQIGALAREFVFSVISLTVQINTNCYFLQSPGIYTTNACIYTFACIYDGLCWETEYIYTCLGWFIWESLSAQSSSFAASLHGEISLLTGEANKRSGREMLCEWQEK